MSSHHIFSKGASNEKGNDKEQGTFNQQYIFQFG